MNSAFDYRKYTELMDIFIHDMETVPTEYHPDIPKIFTPLCQFLKIGKIEVTLTEFHTSSDFSHKSDVNNIKHMLFYNSENVSENNIILFSRMIGDGSKVEYKIYPLSGQNDWSDEEKKRIDTLITLTFAFNGRARVINIASEMTFKDRELGINTFTYFMKNTNILYEKHEISAYCGCFFNLRRFSVVNMQFGRKAGTMIMREYLNGLNNMLSDDYECIGRVGGDNFVILFKKDKLDKIKNYLESKTLKIETDVYGMDKVTVTSYAGYFMADENSSPAYLMDRLSIAQNIARSVLKTPFVFFNENLKAKMDENKNIENLFVSALENEEFMVYYQPKVLLKDFSLVGAEALCRWKLNGKVIQPSDFIPVLERSHYICMLDFYMLEHVCRDIRRWLDNGLDIVKVSVNLSRVHLGNINILEKILGIVDKYNIPHKHIEIELTETTTDVDYSELKQLVTSLNQNGISTSVDDFGVGYSSLNLIRDLPWDVLKIDKSFLPDKSKDEDKIQDQKEVMLKYIIAMANTFGLECISEGVESVEHIELLRGCKCQNAQGFYFDKPLPVENFEKRLYEFNNNIQSYPCL